MRGTGGGDIGNATSELDLNHPKPRRGFRKELAPSETNDIEDFRLSASDAATERSFRYWGILASRRASLARSLSRAC